MDLKNLLFEAIRYSEEIKSVFITDYQKILDENDLSTKQSHVLGILKNKKKLTMHEVATLINGTPSAASQFIAKLEKKKYVKRDINVDNRREVFVTLDANGEKFFKDLDKIDEVVLEKYFMKLPEDDIVTYHRILKKLHKIVTNENKKEEAE